MSDRRNVLIVLAHPEPASFNHALAQAMAGALRAEGHHVTISDLAANGFRAELSRADFQEVADPDRFHVQAEQAHAARTGSFAPEIAREQALVAAADNLIVQFPMWWSGPPALIKGWFERVMSYGFAYVDGARFETGLFKGRRAMLSVTTGGTTARFSDEGQYGPIEPILMPFQRLALEYLGYEVAEPVVSFGVPRTDALGRSAYLTEAAKAALALAQRPVTRTDAWSSALDLVPENAWARNA